MDTWHPEWNSILLVERDSMGNNGTPSFELNTMESQSDLTLNRRDPSGGLAKGIP